MDVHEITKDNTSLPPLSEVNAASLLGDGVVGEQKKRKRVPELTAKLKQAAKWVLDQGDSPSLRERCLAAAARFDVSAESVRNKCNRMSKKQRTEEYREHGNRLLTDADEMLLVALVNLRGQEGKPLSKPQLLQVVRKWLNLEAGWRGDHWLRGFITRHSAQLAGLGKSSERREMIPEPRPITFAPPLLPVNDEKMLTRATSLLQALISKTDPMGVDPHTHGGLLVEAPVLLSAASVQKADGDIYRREERQEILAPALEALSTKEAQLRRAAEEALQEEPIWLCRKCEKQITKRGKQTVCATCNSRLCGNCARKHKHDANECVALPNPMPIPTQDEERDTVNQEPQLELNQGQQYAQ